MGFLKKGVAKWPKCLDGYFKQLPYAHIRAKFKNFCAYQIANNQTIVLNTEKRQKVHSRPKLLQNWVINERCPLSVAVTGTIFYEIQKFLCPSVREPPGDYFRHWYKDICSLSYGQSKFGPKLWYFMLRFYTNPSLFLAFTNFTSSVYFFGHFKPTLKNPSWRDGCPTGLQQW